MKQYIVCDLSFDNTKIVLKDLIIISFGFAKRQSHIRNDFTEQV